MICYSFIVIAKIIVSSTANHIMMNETAVISFRGIWWRSCGYSERQQDEVDMSNNVNNSLCSLVNTIFGRSFAANSPRPTRLSSGDHRWCNQGICRRSSGTKNLSNRLHRTEMDMKAGNPHVIFSGGGRVCLRDCQ